ncbi:TetR family transcriptional regulator [Nonomuraea rubra]|uniref:TetR family transcriptional regulator n=1 Tax=Nonomuraea rubra TaxID=46180 RepID=A0A7X0NYA2_9ACTN|nr:TetR family transcriptional regulator [Nonomuraea rubra]MBB6551616.1 hypothetical protein [Nonomuraea rubra]
MRSSEDADLTARARIRNAALELFGAEGVGRVSLRAVATRAGAYGRGGRGRATTRGVFADDRALAAWDEVRRRR